MGKVIEQKRCKGDSYLVSTVIVNGYKPLVVGERRCLSYKNGKIFTHFNITDKPVYFGKLPMTAKQRLLSMFRMTERMFRLEPRMALEVGEGKYILSFCGAIYCLDIHEGTILREHNYRPGMNNPLNFCEIEGIDGFDNCIAYGEYWGNTKRETVSIYTRRERSWELAYTFPSGTVQHIHGLVADKYRNCVLILTGDKDEESGIWVAKNNFKEVEPILIGSQRYRSCMAFPLEEGILYATDTPLEKNILAIATKEKNGWAERVLYDMPGPCIYGTAAENNYVFATSVEPDSRITGVKYWFTYQLGSGVTDRKSHIIIGNVNDGFKNAIGYEKDILPMLLFQFGNVQFPSGVLRNGSIIMYPVSVRKYDGKTVIFQCQNRILSTK